MYSNIIVKEKLEPVVTLEQAKKQLNVDEEYTADDTHIVSLIHAATGAAEAYTASDVAITKNTLEYIKYEGELLLIDEAPFHSMVEITADGNVIDPADYEIQIKHTEFVIKFSEKQRCEDRLIVTFLTGWRADDAPPEIVAAILVKVNDLYDVERTSYTINQFKDNKTFERLLNGRVINRW